MRDAPPSTIEQLAGARERGVSSTSVAVPSAPRGRGRPRKAPRAAVSFFSVDDAAKLLRTTPDHLRDVLAAPFSFFTNSHQVGGVWKISSRDLERWLDRELKPLLLLSEVVRLMRTTRARVHAEVRRKRLPAVWLFGERNAAGLRFNFHVIARAMGQEQGGIGA